MGSEKKIFIQVSKNKMYIEQFGRKTKISQKIEDSIQNSFHQFHLILRFMKMGMRTTELQFGAEKLPYPVLNITIS